MGHDLVVEGVDKVAHDVDEHPIAPVFLHSSHHVVVESVCQLRRRQHLWQQGGAGRRKARLEGTGKEKRNNINTNILTIRFHFYQISHSVIKTIVFLLITKIILFNKYKIYNYTYRNISKNYWIEQHNMNNT